jgi:hypothetical protein
LRQLIIGLLLVVALVGGSLGPSLRPSRTVLASTAVPPTSNPIAVSRIGLSTAVLGGTADDKPAAIAMDASGSAYVVGTTSSPDLPTTPGALRQTVGKAGIFIAKIRADGATLEYLAIVGGSGVDEARAVAVDGEGSAYVAGFTNSSDFPVSTSAFTTAAPGGGSFTSLDGKDAFVLKMSPDGSRLTYATYLGGTDGESASGIALGIDGSAYVVGSTSSPDFPVTEGAAISVLQNGRNGFVTKLSPDGSKLIYSTFLGGAGGLVQVANGIAVDSAGAAVVVGNTNARCKEQGSIVKLRPEGTAFELSTCLGGGSESYPTAVALDSAGGIYVSGTTFSRDLATDGAFSTTYRGGNEVFIGKLKANSPDIEYVTYLGGSGRTSSTARGDEVAGMAVDGLGNVTVVGHTNSPDFPTTPDAIATSLEPGRSGYLAKLSPDGARLVYGTFLDVGIVRAVAVDGRGSAVVVGARYHQDPSSIDGNMLAGSGGMDDVVMVTLAFDDIRLRTGQASRPARQQ